MYRFLKENTILITLLLNLLTGCSTNNVPDSAIPAGKAVIYPDYTDIVIPVNIAPLNFSILESSDGYLVHLHSEEGTGFFIRSGDNRINIPAKKWKSLLQHCVNRQLMIDIYFRKNRQWQRCESIHNEISSDSVDSHLVYRLIEPGFETWNEMGIYQRDLESFHESPVILNEMSDGNCLNCHSFAAYSNKYMLFHSRAGNAGTVIVRDGGIVKVNTKTDSTLSAGVYPAWHPGGRYVAFSVNHIVQSFHTIPNKRIEVIDTLSDLILYDAEKNCVISNPDLASPGRFETFPSWSPDGRYLYFCSAAFRDYRDYKQIRYNIHRISFDAATEKFGKIDTVIPADQLGYSTSFPRVSPDGKYLLFCKTGYGNFTIWHNDTDLVLLDLTSGQMVTPDINSNRAESYHSWSSNGRWIVFSSRREDGLFTRLYFSYFDKNGRFHKSFLLPQKVPGYNADLLKSFNIPEFVTSKIQPGPRKLARIIRSEPLKSAFKNRKKW